MFHHIASRPRFLMAFFFAILLLGACGKYEPNGDTGKPTPTPAPCADPSFVDAYPHRWALVRQAYIEAYVYDSLISDASWEKQTIWSYYLVDWTERDDGTLDQTETLCAMDASEIVVDTTLGGQRVQQTVVPQKVVDSIPANTWNASFTVLDTENTDTSGECLVEYRLQDSSFGPQYWVFGASLDNPVAQSCPSSAGDPAQYDQDGDGNPGVTTEQWVNGEQNANLYVCSRTLYRFETGAVSKVEGKGYQIQGKMVDLTIDQTMYGSDNSMLEGMDPQSRWSPNDLTYFIMIELPDNATCADISYDLFF